MRRRFLILMAHLKANAYVIADLLRLVKHTPGLIKPPLLVYTRWSVEDEGRGTVRQTRQVGVGYWEEHVGTGYKAWKDYKIFFKEDYDTETKTWKRTIPPQKVLMPMPQKWL